MQSAAALGLLAGARAGAADATAPPTGAFDVHVDEDVGVLTRDSIRLATDVHRPARGGRPVDGRFPTILERTPYGRNRTYFRDVTAADRTARTRARVAADYVRRGYVVIFQDCRGRYGSGGTFEKYVNEGADGVDTCRWIVQQPWSNGRIGTMGLSYAAHTQMALACLGAPGLAAMYVDCGGFSNAYASGIRQGGAFELKQVTWAYNLGRESPQVQRDPVLRAALEQVDLKAWFASMPWKRGHTPISLLPEYEAYVYEQWERGTFGDYWTRPGLYARGYYATFPDVPMVHLSGWYDAYAASTVENYAGLARGRRSQVRLVMGPWTHGARSTSFAGDVEFGAGSTLDALAGADFFEHRVRWFDRHLKDGPPAPELESAVQLFVMGGGTGRRNAAGRLEHGGRWRAERDWPVPDARPTPYYLAADGGLRPVKPTVARASLSYDFDPRDPVPTIGGAVTSGEPLMRPGGFDQRETPELYGARAPFLPLAARPDVLVFQTEPLPEDVEVTGAIEAELWIESDAPDTDFTIKLLDVYPPSADYPGGYALNLTDGILRCRYRDSWSEPRPMQTGSVYRIRVEAFPTSNLFVRGHRIRLDVSSSNFPRFDVNPNTGAAEGSGLTTNVARNTVHCDRARPSHVVLPIVRRA